MLQSTGPVRYEKRYLSNNRLRNAQRGLKLSRGLSRNIVDSIHENDFTNSMIVGFVQKYRSKIYSQYLPNYNGH